MQGALESVKALTLHWTSEYGYHAVVPALLVDPAGVPWAWIFLMLLAAEAGKNIPLLLIYGCAVLSAADYLFYWIGIKGGRPLIHKLEQRLPKIAHSIKEAEESLRGRGIWVIAFGRFLPLVGRYVGIAAGIADVPLARFALFDAIGVGVTVVGFGLLAHVVGRSTFDSPLFAPVVASLFAAGSVLTVGLVMWNMYKRRHGAKDTAIDDAEASV